MALEDITAGDSIATLVTTNPVSGDNVSQGDDHLRNIKKALQFTFPNISATASGVASEFAFAHKGGTVSGNATIKGSLTVSAGTHLSTLSVGGAAVLAGAATLDTTLSVSGATHLKTTLSVGGAAHLASTLTAVGATHLQSTLSVGGVAQFGAGINVSATLNTLTLTVGGNATLLANLTVVGNTHLKSALSVGGNVQLNGSISISGNTNIASALFVSGAAHLSTTLSVGGAAKLDGTLSVAGVAHLNSALSVGGNVQLNGSISVSGNTNVRGNLSVGGTTNLVGAVTGVDSAAFATSASRVNGIRMYAARVGADATALWNPHGWSFSLGATDVAVVHNIGVSSYAAVATVDGLQTYVAINGVTNNGFRMRVNDVDGTATQAVVYLQVAASQ